MITPDMLAFIRKSRSDGMSPADIEASLKTNGWQQQDIAEAYATIARDVAPQSVTPGQPIIIQTVNPTTMPSPTHHNGKKALTTSLISIIAICAVGAIAYGAYFAFNKYVAQSPEQKIRTALLNLKGVTSFDSTFKISSSYNDPTSYTFDANITVNNEAQGLVSTSTTQTQGDIDLAVQASTPASAYMPSASYNIDTDIAYRYLDNVIYAELVKAPSINPMIDAYLNLKKYEGQWIQMPLKDGLNAGSAELGAQPTSLTKEEYAAIYAKYKDRPIFIVSGHSIDDVNSKAMDRYTFTLNASNTASLEGDIFQAVLQKSNMNQSQSQIDQIKAQLAESVPVISTITGQIWIGQSDNMMYKIAVDLDVQAAAHLNAPAPLHFEMTVNSYNQPTTITAPEDSKTLQDFYMSMNPGAAASQTKAQDAKQISDLAQIQLALAEYFDRCGAYPTNRTTTATSPTCPSGITLGTFMPTIPRSPTAGAYNYVVNSNKSDYFLQTTLTTSAAVSQNQLHVPPTWYPKQKNSASIAGLSCTGTHYCVGAR